HARAQEVLRLQDALVREVLVRRCSELGAERADQVELVHTDVIGQLVETNRFGKPLEQVRARSGDGAGFSTNLVSRTRERGQSGCRLGSCTFASKHFSSVAQYRTQAQKRPGAGIGGGEFRCWEYHLGVNAAAERGMHQDRKSVV